jgi:hypothetical protein
MSGVTAFQGQNLYVAGLVLKGTSKA